jgi:hypothetical protein
MTDKHDLPLCLRDREPRGGHIVSQRCRWILNDEDVVTVWFEKISSRPSAAV